MDDGDYSAAYEAQDVARALQRHRQRTGYRDTQDMENKKIIMRNCEDCGIQIPLARVAAVNAIRCVTCQEIFEKEQRLCT